MGIFSVPGQAALEECPTQCSQRSMCFSWAAAILAACLFPCPSYYQGDPLSFLRGNSWCSTFMTSSQAGSESSRVCWHAPNPHHTLLVSCKSVALLVHRWLQGECMKFGGRIKERIDSLESGNRKRQELMARPGPAGICVPGKIWRLLPEEYSC